MTPLPWQTEACSAFHQYDGPRGAMVVAATGCHEAGQAILMHDGSIRAVEDVVVGDLVMGPDSTPRLVLDLHRGRGQMVRVIPTKGDPWVVNSGHVLSLVRTTQGRGRPGGTVIDTTVSAHMAAGPTWKHIHKLFRVPVEFPVAEQPMDPYVLGLLIGDGALSRSQITIHKPDEVLGPYLSTEALRLGDECDRRYPAKRCPYWAFRGTGIRRALRGLGLLGTTSGDKFIPDQYKVASKRQRLEMLAGIMDTDGHMTRGGYDFISKSKRLADDVAFVARSLGLAAYVKAAEKYCQTGGGGVYWRVSITGDAIVPCRITRKVQTERGQKKDVLRTGFKLEPCGDGDYFGFEVDGDHRYLLGDFTVTHNSGKTAFGLLAVQPALLWGSRVLWVAHRQELVSQPELTSKRFWPDQKTGVCAASLKRIELDQQLTFASKDSLKNRLAEYLSYGYPDYVIMDEVHHAASKSYIDLLDQFPRKTKLLGLTATPGRNDSRHLSDRWEIVYSYPILKAVADGVLVTPYAAVCRIPDLDLSRVSTTKGDYDPQELERELVRSHVVEHTLDAVQRTHRAHRLPFRDEPVVVEPALDSILVFTISVDQAQRTAASFRDAGFPAQAVWGEMNGKDRVQYLEEFRAGRLRVLCSADALLEGTDLPIAKVGIIARPTRSHSLFVQMAGRVLRRHGASERGVLLDLVGASREHSLVSAPVLVDGIDCPESGDGQHRFLKLESGEGRCHCCGYLIRCAMRGGAHKFKAGTCVSCGATQCPRSPTREHFFVNVEDHKRACLHCAIEVPDPMAAMVAGSYHRKEMVNWHRLQVQGTVYATAIGKLGIMFNVQAGDKWQPYLFQRGRLAPLSPAPVDKVTARLLTDDVARQAKPKNGIYGFHNTVAHQRIFTMKATHYANTFTLWRLPRNP